MYFNLVLYDVLYGSVSAIKLYIFAFHLWCGQSWIWLPSYQHRKYDYQYL